MRVVVGMSGGVDSAVSALLLKQQGHDVIGVFMNNWEDENDDGICTAESDWADVRNCCDVIGIPYYSVNFSKEYEERVFKLFLDEYQKGRTPNPDVLCNREIKFKSFLDFAMQLDADKIATGHFVSTDEDGRLIKGTDPQKEQSYFLYMLKDFQLRQSLFPVGKLTKEEVREIAALNALPVSSKKDSTGICFIGERNFRTFLQSYLPANPGIMRTDQGEVLGEHIGLMYYTLGQRKGLGIGGHGDGRSYFVASKDLDKNELILVQGADHSMLYSNSAIVEQLTWVKDAPCQEGHEIKLHAKFRYRQPDQAVTFVNQGDNSLVLFDTPQRAITPGQSAVFYKGQVCIGGGIIQSFSRDS